MTEPARARTLLQEALSILDRGFSDLPAYEPRPDVAAIREVIGEVAVRMQDNYPYHHPLYAGQMLKPPHPAARLAYMLSLWINPNNHALDGGRASSAMEKEAVAEIAQMFGWDTYLGHLTASGTIANLEALWIAGRLTDDKKVVASEQAHYTHERLCGVLKLPFEKVPVDARARMDPDALERILEREDVGTVVATIGTTATGSVDPLPAILELQERYGFRLHADAAYGGYFILADNLSDETRATYTHLSEADSIVVDPHKHGLQPYGCGSILFKDPAVGRWYKHDSPYTYFTSSDLHLGEISLECSRAGASAVALWATQRMLPLVEGGEFAAGLSRCRRAALTLHEKLAADSRFAVPFEPELDIVVWATPAQTASEASASARLFFDEAARDNLHLALAEFPRAFFENALAGMEWDRDTITCLRSCLMKPDHFDWIERIWTIIHRTAERMGLPSESR